MRRQHFPFLITPLAPARPGPEQDLPDALPRALRSLSFIESSLEELIGKASEETAWRAFFGALVPILDGIGALREAVEQSGDQAWRRGMEMVSAKLETLLSSRGVERSARVGDAFDPSLHRAVGARRAPGVPSGAIAEVVQEGWTLNGVALRPASVVVCREDA